jgi:hypothetical protein
MFFLKTLWWKIKGIFRLTPADCYERLGRLQIEARDAATSHVVRLGDLGDRIAELRVELKASEEAVNALHRFADDLTK